MNVSFDLMQYMEISCKNVYELHHLTDTPYEELNRELRAIRKHRPTTLETSAFATMLIDCYGAYRRQDYEGYYILAKALCSKKLGSITELLEEFNDLFGIDKFGIRTPLQVNFNPSGKYLNHSFNKLCDKNHNLIETTDFGIDMQKQFKDRLIDKHRYMINNELFIAENDRLIGEPFKLANDYNCGTMATRPFIPSGNLRYYRIFYLSDMQENLYYNFFRAEDLVNTLCDIPREDFVNEVTQLIQTQNLNEFYFKHNPPHPTKPIQYHTSSQPVHLINVLKLFVTKIANTNIKVSDFITNRELTSSIILQTLNLYITD